MSAKTFVSLSEHADRDRQAAEEADGNGRTGFLMKLTVKQVSIVLGIVTTIAGGTVALRTREPKAATEQRATASRSVEEPKVEDLDQRLRSYADTQEAIRADVRDTREQVRDLRGDIRELRSMVRSIERAVAPRRNAANVGTGGGSK